ncbi:hypothetical protein CYMTET_9667 [Cymbomonas tetramitiformis]|uniref:Uncharacterized protein n=1 Tax=Cymbomonas tetramitiformis TaxID=36881 RepID=A0AAE0LEW6_9CHLO|nr:hypothetical protein CYMTET_9667 [Cymbomonas tetramitiformis]
MLEGFRTIRAGAGAHDEKSTSKATELALSRLCSRLCSLLYSFYCGASSIPERRNKCPEVSVEILRCYTEVLVLMLGRVMQMHALAITLGLGVSDIGMLKDAELGAQGHLQMARLGHRAAECMVRSGVGPLSDGEVGREGCSANGKVSVGSISDSEVVRRVASDGEVGVQAAQCWRGRAQGCSYGKVGCKAAQRW